MTLVGSAAAARSQPAPIERHLDALVAFAHEMVASRDLDPMYPTLAALYELLDLNVEDRLWFSVLYVAFYHLPSAFYAWRQLPHMPHQAEVSLALLANPGSKLRWARLPTGIERRGNRGGDVVDHLLSYITNVSRHGWNNGIEMGEQRAWMMQGWREASGVSISWESLVQNYEQFWRVWQTVRENGRWSAFKMAEILKTVHGYPLAAPDMRMEFCSGPREGLEWLYGAEGNAKPSIEKLNAYGYVLREALSQRGLELAWEELETVLCNFNSLRKGKYYVGHDIDEMQEQLDNAVRQHFLDEGEWRLLYEARAAALPRHYRGEAQRKIGRGWAGVDHRRMTAYRDAGQVLTRRVL